MRARIQRELRDKLECETREAIEREMRAEIERELREKIGAQKARKRGAEAQAKANRSRKGAAQDDATCCNTGEEEVRESPSVAHSSCKSAQDVKSRTGAVDFEGTGRAGGRGEQEGRSQRLLSPSSANTRRGRCAVEESEGETPWSELQQRK
eukprot:4102064-Pleurochrysis_carterae.AAC.1